MEVLAGGVGGAQFIPQAHPSGFSTSSFVVLPTGRSYGRVGGGCCFLRLEKQEWHLLFRESACPGKG